VFALIELPKRYSLSAATIFILSSVIIFFTAPPIRNEDHEESGLLLPGDDPEQLSACNRARIMPKDAVEMLVGGSALVTVSGTTRLFAVNKSCHPLSIQRNIDGLAINADVFDKSGKLVAKVTNNDFHVLTGDNSYSERRGDLSTLAVFDG
jgi:hypothetical protein